MKVVKRYENLCQNCLTHFLYFSHVFFFFCFFLRDTTRFLQDIFPFFSIQFKNSFELSIFFHPFHAHRCQQFAVSLSLFPDFLHLFFAQLAEILDSALLNVARVILYRY